MIVSVRADQLALGDRWLEEDFLGQRHVLVEFLSACAGPKPNVIRVTVKDLTSNGVGTLELYRPNRRSVSRA